MKSIFLGHQTWLISHKSTNILIDPILKSYFGHSKDIFFEIFPPRNIDEKQIPKLSAAILTHEHLDHFHLPSLSILPRSTPILTGPLMPNCVLKAIEALGFNVCKIPFGTPNIINNLELILYPPGPETIFWEKRVSQILLRPIDNMSLGIFVAVDALISDDYREKLNNKELETPIAIICSNNSQIVPPGANGAHTNLLQLNESANYRFAGLKLLYELLVRYVEDFPICPHFILCGNGFTNPRQNYGAFLFSDNNQLAQIACNLGVKDLVHGPLPGEYIEFSKKDYKKGTVSWITVDEKKLDEIKNAQRLSKGSSQHLVPIHPKAYEEKNIQEGVTLIRNELPSLAKAIMMSAVGLTASSMHRYLLGELDSKRIILRFLTTPDSQPYQFALDLCTCAFHEDSTPTTDLLTKFPFGLEVHLVDFASVIKGDLQIWDLSGTGIRSWYVGNKYNNLISFLFCYYGEQIRPDLAASIYNKVLDEINSI